MRRLITGQDGLSPLARGTRMNWVWSVIPESYSFVADVLAQRAQDGQTFFALKQPQTLKPENAPNFSDYIDIDKKSGSPVKPVRARPQTDEQTLSLWFSIFNMYHI
ncbi:hypothetical protein [Erwinia sp. PsM31]|nr:hypothetical protein [Erwinia sp. PsM31]MDN4626766.1 hypothetical protein [Erwinia sp. PsM31]